MIVVYVVIGMHQLLGGELFQPGLATSCRAPHAGTGPQSIHFQCVFEFAGRMIRFDDAAFGWGRNGGDQIRLVFGGGQQDFMTSRQTLCSPRGKQPIGMPHVPAVQRSGCQGPDVGQDHDVQAGQSDQERTRNGQGVATQNHGPGTAARGAGFVQNP